MHGAARLHIRHPLSANETLLPNSAAQPPNDLLPPTFINCNLNKYKKQNQVFNSHHFIPNHRFFSLRLQMQTVFEQLDFICSSWSVCQQPKTRSSTKCQHNRLSTGCDTHWSRQTPISTHTPSIIVLSVLFPWTDIKYVAFLWGISLSSYRMLFCNN